MQSIITEREKQLDNQLVSIISTLMVERLTEKRTEGKNGWWDANRCSTQYLRELLHVNIKRDDLLDIIILSAMVYVRERLENK